MRTIAEEIERIIAAKSDIKTALETKGVSADGRIDTFASKILEIPTGGDQEIGSGKYYVKFVDFDGHILKERRVDEGGSVQPPTNPSHEHLVFHSWNDTATNVHNDLCIGAQYTTVDNKTYAFITLSPLTGLSPILYLNNKSSVPLSVDWGDGSEQSTTSSSGAFSPTHTYNTYGKYLITITGVNCDLGSASGSFLGSTNYRVALDKIYVSAVHGLYLNVFNNHFSLTCAMLSLGITVLNGTFANTRALSYAIMPNSVIDAGPSTFSNCGALNGIIMSRNTVTLKSTFTRFCASLGRIKIPPLVTLLEDRCLSENASMLIIEMEPTTPPTLAATRVLENLPLGCRIYVPDSSVNAYKTATNWISFADYIYPVSQLYNN